MKCKFGSHTLWWHSKDETTSCWDKERCHSLLGHLDETTTYFLDGYNVDCF